MGIDFTPDPELYPFESRWFDSTQGRLHYIDEGDGPPLLLCHGNPTWSFLYRNIVIALRDRFRCIAPDYLGFGLSDRPSGFGYKIDEHARVVGEFVDRLGLDGYLTMGQDWGGPISMAVNVDRADRVRGIVLGNTWFWPADTLTTKLFSRVMSSPPMQYAILQHNFFVERLVPAGTAHRLSAAVMQHYRAVQPRPDARKGVAEMPKQILAARPLLGRLAREVPAKLGCQARAVRLGNEGFRVPARPDASADARHVRRPRCRRTARRQALHPGGRTRGDRRGDRRAVRLTGYPPADANASTGGHEHTRWRSP